MLNRPSSRLRRSGVVLSPRAAPHAQDSPLLAAMRDEMTRSMAELRMKGEPAPDFIEYEIDDFASMRAIARIGGMVDDLADRSRTLRGAGAGRRLRFRQLAVRHAGSRSGRGPAQSDSASLDDNYDAIRRQIWLTTDAAYKRAVSVFARKKATFQNRRGHRYIPDFSRETPIQTLQRRAASPSDVRGSIRRSSFPRYSPRTRSSTPRKSGSRRPTARGIT